MGDALRRTEFVPEPDPEHHRPERPGTPPQPGGILAQGTVDARRDGTERVRVEGGRGIPIGRPIAALDFHLDLLRHVSSPGCWPERREWWKNYYGIGGERPPSAEGHYDNALTVEGPGGTVIHRDHPAYAQLVDRTAAAMVQSELALLSAATTLYVTPDMMDLALVLAERELANPQPLRSTDPWAPRAFVVLPPPGLPYWAPEGELLHGDGLIYCQALAWDWASVGHRTTDDPYAPAVEGMGVQLWAWATRQECERAWGSDPERLRELFGPAMLIDNTGWAVDAEWESAADGIEAGPAILPTGRIRASVHVARYRAFVKALWRLLDEEIAVIDLERNHAAARRAQRLGRIPNDGDVVRIVRLRKVGWHDGEQREMTMTEMGERLFSHRWWRRAHWRHLNRGTALLEGATILLPDTYTSADGHLRQARWEDGVQLRLTDAFGRRERITVTTVAGGIGTLQWAPMLAQGMVEVERLANVREHTAGAEDGWLVERYDVHVLER
jgi:hypothetical protein